MNNSALILLSGGIDSTTLLHHMSKNIKIKNIVVLSFNYGQKHSKELIESQWQVDQIKNVKRHFFADLPFLESVLTKTSSLVGQTIPVPPLKELSDSDLIQPSTYVPNRNMLLLSLAASYAESLDINKVYYGSQAQDEYSYWDCTDEFVKKMNEVLSLNRKNKIQIEAPFTHKSKTEIIALGLSLGVNYKRTWTCYNGKEKPCLVCPSCIERKNAFKNNHIPDPLIQS